MNYSTIYNRICNRTLFLLGLILTLPCTLWSQSETSGLSINSNLAARKQQMEWLIRRAETIANPDSQLLFARKARELGKSSGNVCMDAHGAVTEMKILSFQAKSEEIVSKGQLAQKLALQCGDTALRVKAANLLAVFGYRGVNQFENAILVLDEAIQLLSRSPNYLKELGIVTQNQSDNYWEIGKEGKAIALLREYMTIAEKDCDPEVCATANLNFALIMNRNGQNLEALYYLRKSESYFASDKNRSLHAERSLTKAKIFLSMHLTDSALFYASEALPIFNQLHQRPEITQNNRLLAQIHLQQGNYLAAISELNTVVKKLESQSNSHELAEALVSLAEAMYQQGDYVQAGEVLVRGQALAQKNSDKHLMIKVFKLKSDLLYQHQDYKLAWETLQLSLLTRDSLDEELQKANTESLQIRLASRDKENENVYLRKLQQKTATNLRQQQILSYSILLVLVLMVFVVFLLIEKNRQKREQRKKLTEEIAFRTQDLVDANQKLSLANQDLDRFAQALSHEIREPLRNLVSLSSMLVKKFPGLPGLATNTLSLIAGSASHLYEVVGGMLLINRLEKSSQLKEKIDLESMIAHIWEEIQPGLSIQTSTLEASELPSIKGNPGHFRVIIRNLISNAFLYNQSAQPALRIRAQSSSDSLSLYFADNGIGILPENRERIFHFFERLNRAEEYPGTGLGLGLVRRMLELYDGEIHVSDSSVEGSVFVITLPAAIQYEG